MPREIRNAIIESTSLGYEDHNIFTCMLYTASNGAGQGFGGYCLDQWDGSARIGSKYGMEFIIQVMDTLGVRNWEDLKGVHLRVDADYNKIHGIGHIIKNKWFYPERDLKEFVDA